MVIKVDSKKVMQSYSGKRIKLKGDFRKDSAPMRNGQRKPVRANYIYNLFRPRASALTEIAELAKVTSLDLLLIFLSFFNSFSDCIYLLNLGLGFLSDFQIFFIRLLLLRGKSLLESWSTTFLTD